MRSVSVLIALSLVTVATSRPARRQALVRTWITDVTIISPERLDHVERGSVLIENDHIARVERHPGAEIPSGSTVVSGHGQYLIPGLIDSHVHLASIPGMNPDQMTADTALVRTYLEQLPRSYLYFGYTSLVDLTVVDPGVLDDFRRAPLHPDLYDCGPSLPVANGYPMALLPADARFKWFPNFIYESSQASSIPPQYRPDDHTPAADVARVKRAGGICVKTYFERGFGRDRHLPVMSPEVFAEIRRASTQAQLVLMVHANSFEAQKFAVDGGADVLAHGMWNWGSLDHRPEPPPEIRLVLDRIVERKIGYQPTIQVLQGLRAYFDPEYLTLAAIPRVVPQSMLDWFNSPQGRWFKAEAGDRDLSDAAMREAYDRGPLRRVRQVTAYLASRDANFLFGTDTPSSPTYGNLPGLNGYLEMRQLEKAGVSLSQILRAATINNAREFMLDSRVGTIEPGKIANLVLLKRSPLESTTAYDSITMVWLHGKAVSRDSLAARAHR
jgi:hypothetical protein